MEEISREYKDQAYQMLAKVGKAVSSPKRLEILDILMQGAKTVEAVAKAADMSIANTSQLFRRCWRRDWWFTGSRGSIRSINWPIKRSPTSIGLCKASRRPA